jgi:hypothetical protein
MKATANDSFTAEGILPDTAGVAGIPHRVDAPSAIILLMKKLPTPFSGNLLNVLEFLAPLV